MKRETEKLDRIEQRLRLQSKVDSFPCNKTVCTEYIVLKGHDPRPVNQKSIKVLNEFGRRLMNHIISDGSVRAPLVEELLDLCSMEIKYLNPIVEEKITIGKLGFVPVQ